MGYQKQGRAEFLLFAKQELLKGSTFDWIKNEVRKNFELIVGARLEYIELADIENLNATEIVSSKTILLIAGYVGEVRLIDNLLME